MLVMKLLYHHLERKQALRQILCITQAGGYQSYVWTILYSSACILENVLILYHCITY